MSKKECETWKMKGTKRFIVWIKEGYSTRRGKKNVCILMNCESRMRKIEDMAKA